MRANSSDGAAQAVRIYDGSNTKASEPVTARARLVRGGRTVASRKLTLPAGTRALKVTIPNGTTAGAARLKLTLTDAAGNTKAYSRTVHVRRAQVAHPRSRALTLRVVRRRGLTRG